MSWRDALAVVLLVALGSVLLQQFGSMLGFLVCVLPPFIAVGLRVAAWDPGYRPPGPRGG